MNRRCLLSVSDKTHLVDLGRRLVDHGFELVASGGTARALREVGLAVTAVADLTGSPELLGGRVKTLHPAVHGGILAERSPAHLAELEQQGIGPIEVVVCNLYPFADTVAREGAGFGEAIEQIDIGGVTLLRAAAKNCAHVTVLCDPADYPLAGLATPAERRRLAAKAFAHTHAYDAAISTWFAEQVEADQRSFGGPHPDLPARLTVEAERSQVLRYGENPHQEAALYRLAGTQLPFTCLQGRALSYNNLVDLDGAWLAIDPFDEPTVAIIKHSNPCGLASGADVIEAFGKALASDPISAFGSIIAVNRPVDVPLLDAIGKLYVEVLAAPGFTPKALDWLKKRKKNCRAVQLDLAAPHAPQMRTIRGGVLVQSADTRDATPDAWTVATGAVDADTMAELVFAWRAVKAIKSNAIVITADRATVGVGAGQMNRLESVRIAAAQAGEKAQGAVLASDAFFPFADGLEAAAASGVRAVVQPGGSIRDAEVIEAAERLGVALVLTGVRHFRH